MRNPQFSYNKPNAKCIFCSRIQNPHPDFNEPIVTTRLAYNIKGKTSNLKLSYNNEPIVTALFSYNNKEIEVCINCYSELEELSSDQNKSMNSMLQDKLNVSRIFAKAYRDI